MLLLEKRKQNDIPEKQMIFLFVPMCDVSARFITGRVGGIAEGAILLSIQLFPEE